MRPSGHLSQSMIRTNRVMMVNNLSPIKQRQLRLHLKNHLNRSHHQLIQQQFHLNHLICSNLQRTSASSKLKSRSYLLWQRRQRLNQSEAPFPTPINLSHHKTLMKSMSWHHHHLNSHNLTQRPSPSHPRVHLRVL